MPKYYEVFKTNNIKRKELFNLFLDKKISSNELANSLILLEEILINEYHTFISINKIILTGLDISESENLTQNYN